MNWRPIVNVGREERIAAGVLGVVLLASAIRVRHPLRLIAVGLLAYRAVSGNCKGYELLGTSTCKLRP